MDYRFATREDVPLIMEFVKELAIYEKMEMVQVAIRRHFNHMPCMPNCVSMRARLIKKYIDLCDII